MARVWHKPRWIGPVFRLLSRADVLFPETGRDIPTTLVVKPGWNRRGEAMQTWDRTFYFPGRRRHFRSVMEADIPTARVVELQGPRNALEEFANVRFIPPGTIEFLTVRSSVHLGRLRLRLPRRLWITAHVIQSIKPGTPDSTRVQLVVTHAIFGPIFGYEGVFRTRRRPRKGDAAAAAAA